MNGTIQFIQHVLQLLGAWTAGSWAGKRWRSRRAARRVKRTSPNVPSPTFLVATSEGLKRIPNFTGRVAYVTDQAPGQRLYINNGSRWVLIPEEPQ